MSHFKLGFIGCGNMGGAIAKAILSQANLQKQFNVAVFDLDASRSTELQQAGAMVYGDILSLAKECDFIILAVKPYQIQDVLQQIKGVLSANKTIISIAASVSLTVLRKILANTCPAIHILPNTPVLIGEGVFALCLEDPALSEEHTSVITNLFNALGTTFLISEQKMNAFSSVTGCGPAYVFHMMDAVMEAAVTLGFTRDESTRMTTALFKGSVALAKATGEPLGVLHARVTSPAGMTIVGTNHLSRTAVRGHIIDAILAANARGKEMENEI